MCAEYSVKTKHKEIQLALDVDVKNVSKNEAWEKRIKMTVHAPVVGIKDGEVRLSELIFPAQPFPNARLSQLKSNRTGKNVSETEEQVIRITDVNLWKKGFEMYPCIVPMTSFFEPAYWGTHEGDVIEFSDPKSPLLFVPSILIKPRTPSTGKLNGFALLTHSASDQMLKYHHRLLVFLKPKDAVKYLQLGEIPADDRFDFLIAHRYVPKFQTDVDRTMAKGWEKRVHQHAHALEDEKRYLKVLQAEGVRG